MVEISTMDKYNHNQDRFWHGINHNLAIVRLCLDNMSYEFISDMNMSKRSINEGQDVYTDKEKYFENFQKKRFIQLIKKITKLVSNLESNMHVIKKEDDKRISNISKESQNIDKNASFRSSLVKLMIMSLECWEQSTGKNKIDLAEESKLWRINVYNGQLVARTLDRYLNINKLPEHAPRVQKVLKTVYFVLSNSTSKLPIRDKLESTLDKFLDEIEGL